MYDANKISREIHDNMKQLDASLNSVMEKLSKKIVIDYKVITDESNIIGEKRKTSYAVIVPMTIGKCGAYSFEMTIRCSELFGDYTVFRFMDKKNCSAFYYRFSIFDDGFGHLCKESEDILMYVLKMGIDRLIRFDLTAVEGMQL